jgi:stage III sporulation protein AA
MNCANNTLYKSAEKTLAAVLSILPETIAREILSIGESRRDFPAGLSEIRLRRCSASSITLSGESIRLIQNVRDSDFFKAFDSVVGHSLYAHTAEIAEGYVTIAGGVRVGICGDYDSYTRGLRRPGSLVLRMPMSKFGFTDKLLSAWEERGPGGMLIYSPPGCGKTSAIRALAPALSERWGLRVAVIDERREFFDECCTGQVDILSGYGKAKGIEIAIRSLAAEVIVVDEIGSADEANAIIKAGRGGIPVIATAHAIDFDELLQRDGIEALISNGYFGCFARLSKSGGEYFCETENAVGTALGTKPAPVNV